MNITRTYTEDKIAFGELMLKIVQEYIDSSCKNILEAVQLNENKESI